MAISCSIAAADEPNAAADTFPAIECGLEAPQGRNGESPRESLLRQLITCAWQQAARPGLSGPVRVSLESLAQQPSRRWGEPSDIGLGYLHTRVWPVTVQYRRHSEHPGGRIATEAGRASFNCFVNTSREWQCMLVERLPDLPSGGATQTVAR